MGRARSWVVALALVTPVAGILAVGPGWGAGDGPIRKLVVTLPFAEAELILRTEAQHQNLNLVNVLDIQKGMEDRGGTFMPYKIYQFCNLELGIRIYADVPDYGAFQLCSVLIFSAVLEEAKATGK